MKGLWEIADFFRATRRRMQFGEFSRAPLRILRLEVQGHTAECEWLARRPDVWDRALPSHVGDSNVSFQALQDALKLRELLLAELPEIQSAVFHVFRQAAREPPELIITGTVTRGESEERESGPWPCKRNYPAFGFLWMTEDCRRCVATRGKQVGTIFNFFAIHGFARS